MEGFHLSEPSTNGELQLYRVLQRANLLGYYEIFISQGGDDVQQLCEAGEEEFLEIMALVGMASKPLHVRRLQKALQEWVTSPHLFQLDNEGGPGFDMNSQLRNKQFHQMRNNLSGKPNFRVTNECTSPTSKLYPQHSPHHRMSPINYTQTDATRRPHSVPNLHHKARTQGSEFQRKEWTEVLQYLAAPRLRTTELDGVYSKPPTKAPSEASSVKDQIYTSNRLDETTKTLLQTCAAETIDQKYPQRLSFDEAVEHIKTSKKRPHLIRVLEMGNPLTRDKELRRESVLFPLNFADRFSYCSLTRYELMCNEASAHLCRLHPLLLVADRAERLSMADEVVRVVEEQLKQAPRDLLDFSVAGNLPGKAEEIIAKLDEIKVQQEAFKQKILEAEHSKNFVNVLEYQSELTRLKHEEQVLMRQKGKVLTQDNLRSDVSRRSNPPKAIECCHSTGRATNGSLNRFSLQSSSLAELARAHNVIDDSHNEEVPDATSSTHDVESREDKTPENLSLMNDVTVKQEMAGHAFPNEKSNPLKRSNGTVLSSNDPSIPPEKLLKPDK